MRRYIFPTILLHLLPLLTKAIRFRPESGGILSNRLVGYQPGLKNCSVSKVTDITYAGYSPASG